jgi:glycosyltransferase involved in cell wall biosynthesis
LFFRGPKYIETLHSKADAIFTFRRLSFISKLIYKSGLVALCTISEDNKKSLEKLCNINDSALIYNGRSNPIASDKLDQVKLEINSLKNANNDIVFIHIGRCFEAKNQKMLISSFNKLNELDYSFILLIIGPDFDTNYGKELKEMANPKNIFFLDAKTNITDYLFCSDAFCLSSLYEGMPITLIEAFACGCVPICTPISGAIDLIIDGVTGFISEDFTEISYIKAITRYLDNRNKIPNTRLYGLYSDKLTIEKCAKNYVDLYNKLVFPVD